MIAFWLVAAALVAAVLVALLAPLLRRGNAGAEPGQAIVGAFRRQLAELEAELAQGRIEAGEAEAARTEITRRMLAAAEPQRPSPTPGSSDRGRSSWQVGAAVAIAAVLPAAALACYLTVGTPAAISGVAAADGASQQAAELAAAVERIKAHLKKAPGEVKGWVLLARTEATLERYAEAEAAYRRAIALAPQRPELHAELGEALVLSAHGSVTPAAQAEFAKAPDNPRSRFYEADAAAQRGDIAAAKERFAALLADAPADAPWRKLVKDRLAALSSGKATAGRPPTGPSAADIAAAQRMTPEQRVAMIRGMVARLAARLRSAPDDAEGWLKLVRSYRVLGENDKALAALRQANRGVPGNLDLLKAYMAALAETLKDGRVTPDLADVAQRVNALDARQPDALWYLGSAAAQRGDRAEATKYWTRLLAALPAGSSRRALVQQRLAALH